MNTEIINNIKSLGIDMISEANSGHPGIVLGSAPIIYSLYMNHINVNKDVPDWFNRDRFIMSAGHGSALLYATLFMSGFDLSIDDLKNFRKAYSNTPGHPEINITPGVDMSTGPLGQGIASAVGMALAGKIYNSKYGIKSDNDLEDVKRIVDYKVYVLCGDGDLMEGVNYEAASIAGHLKLNNLIVLYDSNDVTLDGSTNNTFSENVLDRFETLGWNIQLVKNGENITEIDKAISRAKGSSKPTIIEVKTKIGTGSLLEGTNKVHGKVLDEQDIKQLKEKLGVDNTRFAYSEELKSTMTNKIYERGRKKYKKWVDDCDKLIESSFDGSSKKFEAVFNGKYTIDLLNKNIEFDSNLNEATRETNHKVMNILAKLLPNFIGGSADTSSSTKTYLDEFDDITADNYDGKNIWFGVREHAMACILNGLALCKFKPFGSTFLAFSDYMKPAIRMSSLMNLPVTYIFSHDSITVGEDGPTHQPIEQLAMFRSIPNFNVYRPADAHELIGCWNEIINNNKPCALILSRGKVKLLDNTSAAQVKNGAYVVRKEERRLSGVIISTGSEVQTAVQIANELYEEYNLDIRVVSMPSMNTFLKQSEEYKNSVLPVGVKKIVIEAGSSFGWHRFVYNENYLITVDKFGISGNEEDVKKYFKFDYVTIKNKVKKLL